MSITIPTLVLVLPVALLIGFASAWATGKALERFLVPFVLRKHNRRLAALLAERHAENPPCTHESSSGVDQDFGPDKVWACDGCGWRHRTVVADGLARDVDA